MSGLLGDAITSFFGGTPAQAQQAPQAAPAPMPTYDQWGRPQGAGAAPAAAVPSLNAGPGLPQAPAAAQGVGASGYDMWGRQAPPPPQAAAGTPQLPGLADIMQLVQQYQAQQAQAQQAQFAQDQYSQGLLGRGSEGGGGGAEGTM